MQHEFEIYGLDNQAAANTATEAAQSMLEEAMAQSRLTRAAALGPAAVETAPASSGASDSTAATAGTEAASNAGTDSVPNASTDAVPNASTEAINNLDADARGAVENASTNVNENGSMKPPKEPRFLDLDANSLYKNVESKKEVSREAKLKILDSLVNSEKATSAEMFKKFEGKMLDGVNKKDKFEEVQKDKIKILDGPKKLKLLEADVKEKLDSEDKSELIRQKKEKLNAMSQQKELSDKPVQGEPFSDIYPKPGVKPTEQKPGSGELQSKPGVNSTSDVPIPGATTPQQSMDRKPEAGKIPAPGADNPKPSTDAKVSEARAIQHDGKGDLFDLGSGMDARLPDGTRVTTNNNSLIVEQGGVRTKVNSDGSMTITQNGQELRLSADQAREERLDKGGSTSLHYSDGSTVTRRQVLRNATELALTLPDGRHYSINPANPQKLEFVRNRR